MRQRSSMGSSRLMMGGAGLEYKCKACGKSYIKTPEYVYRDFCSWSCLRAAEKKSKAKVQMDKARKAVVDRIRECDKYIAHYKDRAADVKSGSQEQNTALRCVRRWSEKREEAQAELEEMRRLNEKRDS